MSVSRAVEWGVLQGMRKVETVEQMPEEYRQVLLKLIGALASTEFASVEQHQPWINKGPTPEDRYIQAQIAADEAHQGFIDCRLLRSFGPDGAALADDLLHRKMGEHAVRNPEYARLAGAAPGDVQRAIDKWYPRALDTFGKSDSRASRLAVAYGLRRWGNAELRGMYKEDIDAQLTALGLTVPPEDRGRKIL